MSIERLKASRIPTLDASNLTYQVENVRVHESEETESEELLAEVNFRKEIPSNLEYIDDFYDPSTGFRVIIMTQANSQVNTRVLELLPKFKIKKNESLVCCLEQLLRK